MKNLSTPDPVKSAQALFFINTALWLYLAGLALSGQGGDGSEAEPISRGIMAILMLGNAALMFWCGLTLGKRLKLYYYIAVMVLVVNVILMVTDQVGIPEILTLLVDMALLGLLGFTTKHYARS